MRKPIRLLVMAFNVLLFLVPVSYSLVLAAATEITSSKINILYKNTKQTSSKKSLLDQGDALLTGTNIQILIEGFYIRSYDLFMEKDGDKKTSLAEKIKIGE